MKSESEIFEYYQKSLLWPETFHDDAASLFLESEINRRRLQKGEVFPLGESSIAQALGVGRQTVSHAWSELQQRQLVQKKKGKGTIVLKPDELIPSPEMLEACLEIRRQAEISLTCLALKNASSKDIKELEARFTCIEKAVLQLKKFEAAEFDSDSHRNELIYNLFLCDLEFHASIRRLSGDTWLQLVSEIAETKTQFLRFSALLVVERPVSDFVDLHRQILSAIVSRNESDAREAVENHFQSAYEWTKKHLENLDQDFV